MLFGGHGGRRRAQRRFVITTPFSFFASASSSCARARPVFADVDPETLNLIPSVVEQRLKLSPANIRASCRSILWPVRGYGWLGRVAAEFKLLVIEDAAQAVGRNVGRE